MFRMPWQDFMVFMLRHRSSIYFVNNPILTTGFGFLLGLLERKSVRLSVISNQWAVMLMHENLRQFMHSVGG